MNPNFRERGGGSVHAFITGASGFIGKQLAMRLLMEGKRVRFYARRPASVTQLQQQGAQVVTGDLEDIEQLTRAVEGAETVYHLAGMTSAIDGRRMMQVNGEGTYNVAQACANQSQPPVLVHVSSIAASGPTLRKGLRRETDSPAPISVYGRSKLAGEVAVARFAQEVPVTIVRPGIVYGPNNRDMLPIFQTIRYLRFHPVVGWRTPALSFIYVEDVIELLIRVAGSGSRLCVSCSDVMQQLTAGRGIYFACGLEHPDYAEFGRVLRKLLERPNAPIVNLPYPLAWIIAATHELRLRLGGRSDTFNRDKIREAKAQSWACAGELAQRDLGFAAAHTLAERLQTTVDWYQNKGWL